MKYKTLVKIVAAIRNDRDLSKNQINTMTVDEGLQYAKLHKIL